MLEPAAYFTYLRSRAEKEALQETLFLRAGGKRIRLRFFGIRPTPVMRTNLSLLIDRDSAPEETPEEEVFVFADDLAELAEKSMVPSERQRHTYYRTADWQILYPGITERLAARDNRGRTTFVAFVKGGEIPVTYLNKPFVNELQWWLLDRFFVVHGAAVGAGDGGALILGKSGSGKSTLALAGLPLGMTYAADDYVLVNREGPVCAHPIFSAGYLTPYAMDKMPFFRPHVLAYAPTKNKYLTDLSAWQGQFAEALPLSVIIYPNLCGAESPRIARAKEVPLYVEALTSTARQIKSMHRFADAFMPLFMRFKDLPAYTMDLTADPLVNAGYLRDFLAGMAGGEMGDSPKEEEP